MEIALLLIAGPIYFVLTKLLGVKPSDAGEIALGLALFIGVPALVLFVVFAG